MTERQRIVDCPRCHEQCGWCSDYRWMHGRVSLPGTRRKCDIYAMQPDSVCPVCNGARKVQMTVTYTAIEAGEWETNDAN